MPLKNRRSERLALFDGAAIGVLRGRAPNEAFIESARETGGRELSCLNLAGRVVLALVENRQADPGGCHCLSNTSTCENLWPFLFVPSSVIVRTFPSGETDRMAMPTVLPSRFSSDLTVSASMRTAFNVS